MTIRATPLLTLSLLALLSTTSLANAGFIWLSPDDKPLPNAEVTYTPMGEAPEAQAKSDGRNWQVEETAPVPLAPLASAPVDQSMSAAAQEVQTILEPNTMASAPVVAPGEQTAAPIILSSTPPAMPAPAAEPVVLAASSSLPVMESAPMTRGMPTAQALIDQMPSMTAPRSQAITVAAPVVMAPETVVVAPVVAPAATPAAVSPITGATLAPETMPVAAAAGSAPLQGFGKQVPLVVAVRQIMPQGYTFVRGEGVDLSQSVNWQGGKVWTEVLTDAVTPLGLTAQVAGDTVVLSKAGAPAPVMASDSAVRPVLGNGTMMATPVN
jgi:hypothetical protein